MPALASDLRKTLENTVVKARDKAESGARDALTALAVDASEPFGSMSEEERKLRNRLRARGRQLGDQRDPQKGSQSIERLVREMAYEHWHRMLFARFLAENQLLIEPTSGVAISLDECEELATEEGTDLWGLAAQFAQLMLPQIFRGDDPVLAAKLPLEIRQQLQGLVSTLAAEVFSASDSLGWVYQFWQALEKERVNQSETKIGADELPAVTQLFTEPYMVDFLLHNSLGAWWVTRHRNQPCPVELSYLRCLEDGTPAAGGFQGWPDSLKDFTLLDPCCGSGHFLVAAFLLLVPMRMASEGLSPNEAVDAVLAENLHGLELDARCVEIAVFALALAAWRFPGESGKPLGVRKGMPSPQIACCGLELSASSEQWQELVPADLQDCSRLRAGLAQLHHAFGKARFLGSLLSPSSSGQASLLAAGIAEVRTFLDQALRKERNSALDKDDLAATEMVLTARGLLDSAIMLDDKYNLVITNVPFKTAISLDDAIKKFIATNFSPGKANLATAMALRMERLAIEGGCFAYVAPQNWMALKGYEAMRRHLLGSNRVRVIARLGDKAFESPGSNGEQISLNLMSKDSAECSTCFFAIDASAESSTQKKGEALCSGAIHSLNVKQQLGNPQAIITFEKLSSISAIGDYATALCGVSTSDSPRFIRKIWEISPVLDLGDWELHHSTTSETALYAGMDSAIYWQNEKGELAQLAYSVRHLNHNAQNWRRGKPNWGLEGIAISQMGELEASVYVGNIYDNNCTAIVPKNQALVPALWLYAESGELSKAVRKINQKRSVEVGTFLAAEFDASAWIERAKDSLPQGLPKPFSNDPTQWLFHGHPHPANDTLHIAVARLLGYRWPAEMDASIELSDEAHEWITRCNALASHADEDGIVCLPSVRGELAAHERLGKLLAHAFGSEWSAVKERELLLAAAVANNSRKPDPSLDTWLRSSFFGEHCKLFQSRPFIWQVWDGNPSGFSALVNAHKLAAPDGKGRKSLELLTFTYLGDWINRQKLDQSEGVNGADDRLSAALDLQGQLKKILDGEPPYDLFVRWKPLHQQPIGWEPDINDGVRLNIRPFLGAQLRKGGKAGAGILRAKPGAIQWSKDRGKEPMRSKEDFPWFWGWDENSPAMATDFGAPISGAPPAGDGFDGNRWNDLHYSLAAKEAARARHRGEG
ncbi:MAG: DNA methyltransferase [Synechococcus sp. ELA057]